MRARAAFGRRNPGFAWFIKTWIATPKAARARNDEAPFKLLATLQFHMESIIMRGLIFGFGNMGQNHYERYKKLNKEIDCVIIENDANKRH